MALTIDEIIVLTKLGPDRYYYSRQTLRWWRTRFHHRVYPGSIYVQSDRPFEGERRYTVNRLSDNSSIIHLSEVGEYRTLKSAVNAAKRASRLYMEGKL